MQEIEKAAAPDSLPEKLPAPESGSRSPRPDELAAKPAKEWHEGASTPESGEISEPEAPAKEVTGPEATLPPPDKLAGQLG